MKISRQSKISIPWNLLSLCFPSISPTFLMKTSWVKTRISLFHSYYQKMAEWGRVLLPFPDPFLYPRCSWGRNPCCGRYQFSPAFILTSFCRAASFGLFSCAVLWAWFIGAGLLFAWRWGGRSAPLGRCRCGFWTRGGKGGWGRAEFAWERFFMITGWNNPSLYSGGAKNFSYHANDITIQITKNQLSASKDNLLKNTSYHQKITYLAFEFKFFFQLSW